MTRVSPKALIRLALWVWLLSALTACGKAAFEKAEDEVCDVVGRDMDKLPPGAMKDAVWAAKVACDVEEMQESDGGK